jgi:serine/threonine protein kinase
MNLAHSFVQLHAKGLCYRDISDGNIFYHPMSGDVRIADNDNVGVKDRPGEVAGTRGYMAPEVVRREAVPSRTTDLHSLAVVLFQILVLQHPLVGKREWDIPLHMSEENQIYFYGRNPVFIFDPVDHSNELVPGQREYEDALAAWPIYPAFIRDLFTRAFTDGLRDPDNGRVTDGEWRRAFARLRDSIFCCPACGEENFLDEDAVRAANGAMHPCRHCGAVPPIPPHIKFSGGRVILNRDTLLFPHHVDSRRPYDFTRPVAAVTASPPPVLQNLTGQTWTMRSMEGGTTEIPPGGAAPLADRATINFGSTEGVVRL